MTTLTGTCPPRQHDEVDILGLDGHIYKGRMDTRLPGILTKDGECWSASLTVHVQPSRNHWPNVCR